MKNLYCIIYIMKRIWKGVSVEKSEVLVAGRDQRANCEVKVNE